MKFRKIYLLYFFTIIPAILMIGFLLGMNSNISFINEHKGVTGLGYHITLLINQLFVIYLKYLALILITSAAFLALRFFKTTSGWISLSIHILLSVFLGGALFSVSFAVAAVVGKLFGWNIWGN